MTQYKYSSLTNELVEVATMEEPDVRTAKDRERYLLAAAEYDYHIETLKRYPCCKDHSWIDGQIVKEGEFEVRGLAEVLLTNPPKEIGTTQYAYPTPKQEDQGDVRLTMSELTSLLSDAWEEGRESSYEVTANKEEAIKSLISKYSL